ncbi:hypothetical protein C8F01DRAFT_1107221 [Mycena amicta]|nr:hypothetical protein C8F01DRAFT_1107221 [Mycena amicta]
MSGELKEAGNAFHQRGEYAQAYNKYTEAIAQDPNNAILYANRAASCLKMKNYLGALSDAQEAATIDPAYTKAWSRVASAAEELRYWETTRNAYTAALSSLDNDANISPDRHATTKLQFETGFARATEIQKANLPRLRGATLARQNALKRGILPSSGWVILFAFVWFDKGYQAVRGMQMNGFGVQVGPFAGVGIQFDQVSRALEGLTSGLIFDKRAVRGEPGFIEKMEIQIKIDVIQRLRESSWDPVRKALAVTVRIWIFKGFIDSTKGEYASAIEHFERTINILEWGERKYANVHRNDRGAHFEPSFIRGVRRLYVPTIIALFMKEGPAAGRTLDDIEKLAHDFKSDTEASPPFPDREGEPGFYAAFWLYPVAQALCYLGWVHKRRALDHEGSDAKSERTKEFTKSAKFYVQSAETYPEDDEERPFSFFTAFEILCWNKMPLRVTLPLCRKIQESMRQADVIWAGARVSMESEKRAADCYRAIAFYQDCEKKIANGTMTLDDATCPDFVRARRRMKTWDV